MDKYFSELKPKQESFNIEPISETNKAMKKYYEDKMDYAKIEAFMTPKEKASMIDQVNAETISLSQEKPRVNIAGLKNEPISKSFETNVFQIDSQSPKLNMLPVSKVDNKQVTGVFLEWDNYFDYLLISSQIVLKISRFSPSSYPF